MRAWVTAIVTVIAMVTDVFIAMDMVMVRGSAWVRTILSAWVRVRARARVSIGARGRVRVRLRV